MTAQQQQQQQRQQRQQQQRQQQQRQQQQQQQQQQRQQNQRVPPHASKGGSVTGMPLEYYGKDSGNYFSAQEVSGLYSRPYSNLPAGFSRGGIYATFPGRLAGGDPNSLGGVTHAKTPKMPPKPKPVKDTSKETKGKGKTDATKKPKLSPSKTSKKSPVKKVANKA